MAIGMVLSSLSRKAGGIFDASRMLAEAVGRTERARVRAVGLEDEWTSQDRRRWAPTPVMPARPLGPAAFGYSPELGAVLENGRFDLLHLHGIWMYPSVACEQWRIRTGRPVVISPHGMLDKWALARSRVKKILASLLFQRGALSACACLHALNDAEAASFREFGLENPICVLPNGVDRMHYTRTISPSWKSQVPSGPRLMLFLGRLHPKKGIEELLAAWALLQRRDVQLPRWRLILAGWGERRYVNALTRRIMQVDIGKTVLFVGPQFGKMKNATLAACNAFVLPSKSEGMPVAVLEAWAAGLPVLMTKECNLEAGFDAGAAVKIQYDARRMASGIRRFMELPDSLLRRMGQRGRALVREKFNWGDIGAQMAEVYAWLLGRGSRPSCVRMT